MLANGKKWGRRALILRRGSGTKNHWWAGIMLKRCRITTVALEDPVQFKPEDGRAALDRDPSI
jgi:hypothetical protein